MKLRESGMPPQGYGETLHDVPRILNAFGFGAETGNVADLGGGGHQRAEYACLCKGALTVATDGGKLRCIYA